VSPWGGDGRGKDRGGAGQAVVVVSVGRHSTARAGAAPKNAGDSEDGSDSYKGATRESVR